MNAKDAILKIRALFEDMPVEEPKEEMPKETKVEMAEYSLEDGTKVMISELAIDGVVTLEDGSFAPMGEHKLADGNIIVVGENGVIVEIKNPEDVVVEEAPEVEEELKKKEDKMAEIEADLRSQIDSLKAINDELNAKIQDIENKNKEGFRLVVEMMEAISKVPSADPIEAPKSFKFDKTNDIKAERLNRYRQAILNNKN